MCIYKLSFAILEIDIHTYLLVEDLSWPKKERKQSDDITRYQHKQS